MKYRALAFAVLLVAFSTFLAAEQITGDYVETRSADVYTGQCFANGEAGLVGDEAILGWHIRKGSWNRVPLDGLSVVGVVKARATLGDPYGKPFPANSVIIVDDHASPAQRAALLAFAHHMGGELLAHVIAVESAPVEMVVGQHMQHGASLLRAGNFATVQTRALNEGDHICGNEETYYPPLTEVSHSMPVVAVTDQYRGPALGAQWETHGKRSAFVGAFAQ